MSKYLDEQEDVVFSEPIIAQKGVRLGIGFAAHTLWEAKTNGLKDGRKFDACKLTLNISDDSVKTEHADSKPRMTIEDQFNVEQFPYEDKKTGEKRMLGRTKLYQLEQVFGFEPLFMVNNERVEPFITKAGNKVAPKIEGVKRVINHDFFNAYFKVVDNELGGVKAIPVLDNWIGKVVYADVEVQEDEKFGAKNTIARFVKAPNA